MVICSFSSCFYFGDPGSEFPQKGTTTIFKRSAVRLAFLVTYCSVPVNSFFQSRMIDNVCRLPEEPDRVMHLGSVARSTHVYQLPVLHSHVLHCRAKGLRDGHVDWHCDFQTTRRPSIIPPGGIRKMTLFSEAKEQQGHRYLLKAALLRAVIR
jgi:hypothetical protein